MSNYNNEDEFDEVNNDPIQEVGLNIFVKSKSFEENDEYQIEKDMKNYYEELKKENNEYNNNISRKDSTSHKKNLSATQQLSITMSNAIFGVTTIFIIIFAFLLFIILLSNENPTHFLSQSKYVTTTNLKNAYIEFTTSNSIPTLEECSPYATPIDYDYKNIDTRISQTSKVQTFQITYTNYTPIIKNNYCKYLNKSSFTFYKIPNSTNYIYILETSDSFLFVLPMDNSVLYGKGNGDYMSIFGLN